MDVSNDCGLGTINQYFPQGLLQVTFHSEIQTAPLPTWQIAEKLVILLVAVEWRPVRAA
jgi:hypothetical protein